MEMLDVDQSKDYVQCKHSKRVLAICIDKYRDASQEDEWVDILNVVEIHKCAEFLAFKVLLAVSDVKVGLSISIPWKFDWPPSVFAPTSAFPALTNAALSCVIEAILQTLFCCWLSLFTSRKMEGTCFLSSHLSIPFLVAHRPHLCFQGCGIAHLHCHQDHFGLVHSLLTCTVLPAYCGHFFCFCLMMMFSHVGWASQVIWS